MSIRSEIINTSPFFDLITERFSASGALAYAIEGHLRRVQNTDAIDGFKPFYVLEETDSKLHVAGLAYVLPSSLVPMDRHFNATDNGIQTMEYRIGSSWAQKTKGGNA